MDFWFDLAGIFRDGFGGGNDGVTGGGTVGGMLDTAIEGMLGGGGGCGGPGDC
jgi:hypothetical protein